MRTAGFEPARVAPAVFKTAASAVPPRPQSGGVRRPRLGDHSPEETNDPSIVGRASEKQQTGPDARSEILLRMGELERTMGLEPAAFTLAGLGASALWHRGRLSCRGRDDKTALARHFP